jgi:hypothetical protein
MRTANPRPKTPRPRPAGPSSATPGTPFTPAARLRGPDALATPDAAAALPGARAAAALHALSPGQVAAALQRGGNGISEVYAWYTEMVRRRRCLPGCRTGAGR